MSDPLVSVIIPTYNRADTIGEAIDSVLGQTYPEIEIIVVDDGSTDNTAQILESYGGKIHVIHQVNSGVAVSRNRGIEIAMGEILTFLDSDDLWLPTKLSRQIDMLKRVDKSIPCCICDTILHRSTGNKQRFFEQVGLSSKYEDGIWLNVAKVASTRFISLLQAFAIRREAMDRIGKFDESLWVMEDHDLVLRLALLGPWAYIAEPLVIWRGGSKHSLYDQAYQNQVRLYECVVRVYQNILKSEKIDCHSVCRYLKRSLAMARHDLLTAKILQKKQFWSLPTYRLLKFIGRVRNALFRRSPWYPKMEVKPLNQ